MQQNLPPLSAFGWFIDTRCGPPRGMPSKEDPKTPAATASPVADDSGEPRPTHRLRQLLARLPVTRHSNPKVISAGRPSEAH